MGSISRWFLFFGYSLILAILVANGLLTSLNVRDIVESDRAVSASRQILGQLAASMNLLVDAETGQRGYLLTSELDYLTPYRDAVAGIDGSLDRLAERAESGSSAQRGRIAELRRLAAAKLAELKQTVDMQESGESAGALAIIRGDSGRRLMVEAREVAARIAAEEDLRLARLTERFTTAARRTVASFVGGTSLTLLLLLSVVQIKRREETEARKAAESLRQGESWFRTTLEGIGDAVVATDEHGRIRLLNPIAEALTGWTKAEAQGRPIAEAFRIVNETTRAPVENPIERVIEEGLIVGLANHTVLIAKGGTRDPDRGQRGPDQGTTQGRIVGGVVMVFRDVRDRRQQEHLEAEQKQLAEFGRDVGLVLTEASTAGEMLDRCVALTVKHLDGTFARIWTVDEPGETLELRASAGLYTHIDGPHARVPVGSFKIGRIARDRKPHLTNTVVGDPSVPAQEWAEKEGIVSFAGFPLIVEDRVVGVWGMFARKPLSEGTLRAMGSVAHGIALGIEQKRSAENLARNEAWLSTTLRSIGDAVMATDEAGRVRFMNPVAEAMTGWPGSEAVGRPMAEVFRIVHEYTREPAEPPVAKVIREGVVVGLANHTLLIARDGTETPIEETATPILGRPRRGSTAPSWSSATSGDRNAVTRSRARTAPRRRAAGQGRVPGGEPGEGPVPRRPQPRAEDAAQPDLAGRQTSMLERHAAPPEEQPATLEMIRQNVDLQARLIDDLLDVMRIVQGKLTAPLGGEPTPTTADPTRPSRSAGRPL